MKCKKAPILKVRSDHAEEWEKAKAARKKLKMNPLKKKGTPSTSVKEPNNDAVSKVARQALVSSELGNKVKNPINKAAQKVTPPATGEKSSITIQGPWLYPEIWQY